MFKNLQNILRLNFYFEKVPDQFACTIFPGDAQYNMDSMRLTDFLNW